MLERIEIENLGSIRKASVPLGPLTVLLGANASGKTTVLRGIELFAKLRNLPWSEVNYAGALLTGAQWPDMLNGGDATKRLIFRGFVQPDSTEPDYEMQLGIDWERVSASIVTQAEAEQQAEPEFLQERLRDPGGEWIDARAVQKEYSIRGVKVTPQRPHRASISRTILRMEGLPPYRSGFSDLIQYAKSFGTARYFRPTGSAMLVATFDETVWPDGMGFVAALAALQNSDSERFQDIERHLQGLFPHIQHIRFSVGAKVKDREDYGSRKLIFETTRSARRIPASMEADGVLTTLFLLWAGVTTPPHGMLLIDEPEAALHPHLMGKRVEFLRDLAHGKFTGYPLRVVVAPQSVDFVRWLDPSEICVVEHGQDTGTLVHTIPESETLRTLVDKFQANAGDLWYSGALGGVPGTEDYYSYHWTREKSPLPLGEG